MNILSSSEYIEIAYFLCFVWFLMTFISSFMSGSLLFVILYFLGSGVKGLFIEDGILRDPHMIA